MKNETKRKILDYLAYYCAICGVICFFTALIKLGEIFYKYVIL